MARCSGKNARGEPCGARAVGGTRPPRCFAHAGGKVAEKRAEGRKRGGESRMRQVDRASVATAPLRVGSQAEAAAALARVADEVWAGKLDPRSANAITGALQALLRPGLLSPVGAHAEFFEQFEEVEISIERDREGTDFSEAPTCFGVLKGGKKVLLTGDLARAAYQRANLNGVDVDFEPKEDDRTSMATEIAVKRRRNPTVPPPEETH